VLSNNPRRIQFGTLSYGIRHTPEFDCESLAQYAINTGTKCATILIPPSVSLLTQRELASP